MKKVIRLTESDLARIVRRVINESKDVLNEGAGTTAFQTINNAMSGMGTDENGVTKGVYMIKTKADYQECLNLVRKEGYKTIMGYIATDMSWQSEQDTHGQVKDFIGNNKYLMDYQRHLSQFSPNEQIVK
jgi:hypothetical protein